ncbi:MAG: hypothetical protein ACT6SF_13260 [Hydrogenophaga sp.]|uniref:hypothetical protein n=1 Tax=Hydrogenophaga sp. TaxID=1904254 RepID=UPI004036718C
MDINDKIAQRRRELEAQRIVNAPIEKAIVERAVPKNLAERGHEQAPAHLQDKIDAATEKALEGLAVKSFTKGDWFEVLSLILGGALFVFAVWWLGLALMGWGIFLFNKKTKFYVHHMKVHAETVRAAREAEAQENKSTQEKVDENK